MEFYLVERTWKNLAHLSWAEQVEFQSAIDRHPRPKYTQDEYNYLKEMSNEELIHRFNKKQNEIAKLKVREKSNMHYTPQRGIRPFDAEIAKTNALIMMCYNQCIDIVKVLCENGKPVVLIEK